MRDKNDVQLGVNQADRDECLRVLRELIGMSRCLPRKSESQNWCKFMGQRVVKGFEFRTLVGHIDAVIKPVLVVEDVNTIRIDFKESKGYPYRCRFATEGDTWQFSRCYVGCAICLGKGVEDGKPCIYCDDGYRVIPFPLGLQTASWNGVMIVNDPQLGVSQADLDECLRILVEVIGLSRSLPKKSAFQNWRNLMGDRVVKGFDFRHLVWQVDVVIPRVMVAEAANTIRIDFTQRSNFPFRSRFTREGETWRMSSFHYGCPACFGEAVNDGQPCEICDDGYVFSFLLKVPRAVKSHEVVARLGGHTTCPWCKRVDTHETSPSVGPASDWHELPFRKGQPHFVCEGCVYDVDDACLFREWAADPNRAVVQHAATVEGMTEYQFRRLCVEHQIALWDEGTVLPINFYLESYRVCKSVLEDMDQREGS